MRRRGRWILMMTACLIAAGPAAQAGKTAGSAAKAAEAAEAPQAAVPEEEALPSYWYAGDVGRKPTVKNQGTLSSCWALTATSALEAALLPGERIVFSADHLLHENAFTAEVEDGGDYPMLMAYFSGWQGPVTEEQDPYGDGTSPEDLLPAVHVQEMRLLQSAGTEELKTWVMNCGSLQTSLFMDRESAADGAGFYRADTAAYYYPEAVEENHDVLILGWDDGFPAEDFASDPGQDGAWICQNTWGTSFGQDGIFYVSYADPNLARTAIAYTRIEGTDNFDRLYQYDDCGWQGQQGYGQESCLFSNVYTAQTDEMLAAVGFYATGPDTSWKVFLVHDFDGTDSFGDRQLLQEGGFSDAGYYTVDLEATQELRACERFAVVVEINTPGENNPAAVEYKADEYTAGVTTEGKESYLSPDGSYWENTQESFGTNVCLKAYTREREE